MDWPTSLNQILFRCSFQARRRDQTVWITTHHNKREIDPQDEMWVLPDRNKVSQGTTKMTARETSSSVARSADEFSTRISPWHPLARCTAELCMRGAKEASFMSARSFKFRHNARPKLRPGKEIGANMYLMWRTVSITAKQETRWNSFELKRFCQTRLKQVHPHYIFGMRNSLFGCVDHHSRGDCCVGDTEGKNIHEPFRSQHDKRSMW